jgi:hypothetical protein
MAVSDTRKVNWVRLRGLAAAVALATALPFAVAGSVPALAAEPASSSSFIDALAAIPAATQALATAREDLLKVQVQRAMAQSIAADSRDEFRSATDTLHELTLVRTRADLVSAQAQEAVDDAARLMYSSGGTVPTLAEVLLTAGSEDELMRSLVTRQYLSSAADVQVQWSLSNGQERKRLAPGERPATTGRRHRRTWHPREATLPWRRMGSTQRRRRTRS